ncbi:MAG: hypothetical protein PF495_17035 [Spirochaetales bacterium]|jgi:hypothetical protein|nr:hypothetical protein [Spirochaetales bacterium]
MKIEVFALCDAATNSHGKLNLLGTFDQIFVPQVPVMHPAFSIALRVRFGKMEEGVHQVQLQLVDPDGIAVLPPMRGEVVPRMGPDVGSVAVNMIFNFHNVKFDSYSDYQINLNFDDISLESLPLSIREIPTK